MGCPLTSSYLFQLNHYYLQSSKSLDFTMSSVSKVHCFFDISTTPPLTKNFSISFFPCIYKLSQDVVLSKKACDFSAHQNLPQLQALCIDQLHRQRPYLDKMISNLNDIESILHLCCFFKSFINCTNHVKSSLRYIVIFTVNQIIKSFDCIL